VKFPSLEGRGQGRACPLGGQAGQGERELSPPPDLPPQGGGTLLVKSILEFNFEP